MVYKIKFVCLLFDGNKFNLFRLISQNEERSMKSVCCIRCKHRSRQLHSISAMIINKFAKVILAKSFGYSMLSGRSSILHQYLPIHILSCSHSNTHLLEDALLSMCCNIKASRILSNDFC